VNPDRVQDLSPHALQRITTGAGCILSILCATVSAIVAITTQLDTVTTQLSAIRKENQELHSNLHALSSTIANNSATHEDIRPLQTVLHDLSHRVTSTPPMARPTVPTARPTAPNAPSQCLPARGQPTPLIQPMRLPPHPMLPLTLPLWPDCPRLHPRKTSTPPSIAHSTTPNSRRCSATLSCMPRPTHTCGKLNSSMPINMSSPFLPLPPSTRTTHQERPPPMRKRPAPAQAKASRG